MKVVSLFGRQFSSWSTDEDESVGHVSRGERKAQTASYLWKSPGTASACEGLIELGNCERVPRENGVEADKRFFSYAGGHKRHFVL